jgi:penicillin-binding protein 1A
MAYPNLPDISDLSDYRPKLPLRVFSSDGVLLGEFGEERRNLTPIKDIPKVMKDAVLAIEDARFYSNMAAWTTRAWSAPAWPTWAMKSQGASTITMQVARNVYLSSEKTYTRKIYEMLLTFKLEHLLTKDQILEIYMNQIFLGNRAYGFAAARGLLRQAAEGHHDRRGGHAGRPAQGAVGLQPDQQPARARARQLLHHRPHGGKRLHHRPQARRQEGRAQAVRARPAPATSGCTPNTWPRPCAS